MRLITWEEDLGDLDRIYRPVKLDDIYGQDKIVSFFKSVISNINTAPHYFLVSGGYGVGKTTISRAFANDLLGSLSAPNYLEIDSGEKAVQDNFEVIKNLLFQEVSGYKVVTLDESHMISPRSQEMLLKVVEDYYGSLVIFFCTTEPHLMMDTLCSRLHKFSLSLFSEHQLKEYALSVLTQEGKTVSDQALSLAALNAQGHMRDMLKQVSLILFQGEEAYLSFYSTVLKEIVNYFTDFSIADKVSVENLSKWHPSELRALMGYFFREDIINPDGRYSTAIPRHLIPRCFANYLRLMGLVKEADDFFSAILVFRQQLQAVRSST